MATIRKFEDLDVWQKACHLAKRVWDLTQKGSFAKDYKLKDQINDACGSVMDNIAEGFERGGNNEFRYFLWISKGSSGEIRSQAHRARHRGHITEDEFTEIWTEANDIGKMLHGLLDSIRQSNYKGRKFKEHLNPERTEP